MIRIAIVEDDKESQNKITEYIARYEKEYGESFSVSSFSDGDEIASDYQANYDIIFLDIQMKRMDGMSAAEIIRRYDKTVLLVFITNMAQYAIKGYSVDALDFILKPVPYFAFCEELKKLTERVKKQIKDYILINSENGVLRLDVSEIVYFESLQHNVIAHTVDREYVFSSSLKDMEKKLEGKSFYRSNSCYIVNLAFVTGLKNNSAILNKSIELAVSRPRKKGFMEALTSFVGGGR